MSDPACTFTVSYWRPGSAITYLNAGIALSELTSNNRVMLNRMWKTLRSPDQTQVKQGRGSAKNRMLIGGGDPLVP